MRYLILDLETAPLPNVADYLDPVEAARNLKDPAKIQADIEKRTQDQLENCGLDWNLNRIVCLGAWPVEQEVPAVWICEDEQAERAALEKLVAHLATPRPDILGFCVRKFDVPVILQRARYLGVKMPRISLKRYDNPHVCDLYDILTFDEQPATSVMRRSLESFCRRFGIEVVDEHSGKDVAALVAAGDYQAVSHHCRADLHRTRLLAERLGVLEPVGAF
jgi:DNA polymerase elongation subunit (family B)